MRGAASLVVPAGSITCQKCLRRAAEVSLALGLSLLLGCATPPTRDYHGVLSITNDNDKQMGSDNNYINGEVIAWAANEVAWFF